MKKRQIKHKIVVSVLTGAMIIPGSAVWVKAEETEEVKQKDFLQAVGIERLSDKYDILHSARIYPVRTETGEYVNRAFSNASDFAYVRKAPKNTEDWIGKIYKDTAVNILAFEGDWAKIQSGSVEGYVPIQFLFMGEDAKKCAEVYQKKEATVCADVLNIRGGRGTNTIIVGQMPEHTVCKVRGDSIDGWVPVEFEGIFGWVAEEYVIKNTSYSYAEPKEKGNHIYIEETQLIDEKSGEAESGREERKFKDTEIRRGEKETGDTAAGRGESESGDTATGKGERETGDTAAGRGERESEEIQFENIGEVGVSEIIGDEVGRSVAGQVQEEGVVSESTDETLSDRVAFEYESQENGAVADEIKDSELKESEISDIGRVDNEQHKKRYGEVSTLPVTGQEIIDFACRFIGNPYVWGGTSLTDGADCSGFVQSVYAHFGINLPRTTWDMESVGIEVNYEEAVPGDLVLYDGHVGLYMGDGTIVNAMNEEDGIGICTATYAPIITVRRVI